MSLRAILTSISLAPVVLVGCGGLDSDQPAPPAAPGHWENRTPLLTVASPGFLSVGDTLTIIGQNFIPPDRGFVQLAFKGNYFDDQGKADPVDLQYKVARPGSEAGKWGGKLSWRLWPSIVFHRSGDHLGYFLGDITATNVGSDGSQQASERLPTKIEIRPSLLPRVARPTGSSCQSVVDGTLENTGFQFAVEAIGLRPASPDHPITFQWSFLAEQWQAGSSYGVTDPNSLFAKTGAFTLEQIVTSGTTSTVQDGGEQQGVAGFAVKLVNDTLGTRSLKMLKTGKVAAEGNTFDTTVNVAAVDSSGKSVKVSIPLLVGRLADLVYDGSMQVAERFPPVMVSDCIPGGPFGVQVTYSEDKSESRSRSLGFNFNVSGGVSWAPIPDNPFAFGINFNAGFGVDVSASVNTSNSKGMNVSAQLLPGRYGAFYRQTSRLARVAHILGRSKCGQTVDLGQAILTDWMFTPELASGSTCVPPSHLPKAEKLL